MTADPNDPAFQLMFTEQDDIDTDEEMIEELYFSMIQRHNYYSLDQAAPKNIYGEPVGEPSYTKIEPQLPIHIGLDPEEEVLDKYGYDRNRDAVAWFSSKILRDRGLVLKVGDRFDFAFINETGDPVVEHFEILEISPWDFVRQAKVPYQVTAAADRTHKAQVT